MDQEFLKGTEFRQHKLFTLKSQAEKQIQFFQKFTKQSEIATLASYQLAWNIAKAKKPYDEGEFVKKCLNDAVDVLSPENSKLISTVIESQLHSDLQACEYGCVALDESCEIQDKPQLAIFARSVSNDCVIKEDLLDIVPLKDRTLWHRCESNNDGCICKSKSSHTKTNCNCHGWSASHGRICERTFRPVQS